jgi:hypothetical protein
MQSNSNKTGDNKITMMMTGKEHTATTQQQRQE